MQYLVIAYWLVDGGTEDQGVDYDMRIEYIVHDLIAGELVITKQDD